MAGVSDIAIIALVSVVVSGLVGITGSILGFAAKKSELAERYRIALYRRRLEVYQQAVKRLVDLQNVVYYTPPLREEVKNRFHEAFADADRWWCDNCLYLDQVSSETLRELFRDVGAWAVYGHPLLGRTAVQRFDESWDVILKGMGWKHTDLRPFTGPLKNHDS